MRTVVGISAVIINLLWVACSKSSNENSVVNPGTGSSVPFNYADSVFYITGAADQIINPLNNHPGSYFSFPEGLSLNSNTGAINVTKSDAGLKYRISFVETGKTDTISTFILISGINYFDGFYNLSTADSILKPVYNADKNAVIPAINNGTTFDEGSNCNSQGCKVNVATAEINLAQTVRNGVFGKTPSNNDRHEFEMTYRINDKSGKANNKLKVKLYYFNSMADVTPEALDIIASRQGTIIGPSNVTSAALAVKAAAPRPPCIFILGH